MAQPTAPLDGLAKKTQKHRAVLCVEKNVISGISTTGNVIYCSLEFDPQRSCHGLNILHDLHLRILDKCIIRHFYKHTPRGEKNQYRHRRMENINFLTAQQLIILLK